ncbi:hypothetical protein HYY71_03150 [Candidatus Woesearchaeota archaeon]|nr:hypothetical protein [Candidatus Woesearchaeota archaeon]
MSNNNLKIVMNHDEQDILKKIEKISVVKQCPGCKQLSLSYKEGKIQCENCGYEEKIPSVR